MPFSNLTANSPVVLHPSQGCYQKDIPATVLRVTPKRIIVQSGTLYLTFLKNGQPIGSGNKDFPRYVLKLT